MTLPYENASSGTAALAQAEAILRRFGCSNFGVMSDWDRGVVIVQFVLHERKFHIEASWQGYAERWMKEYPWSSRRRSSKHEWEMQAKRKGEMAVPSILRDWIKGQVTAVQMGIMPFEHAFMPHMLAHDGRPLIEHAVKLLEPPEEAP